MAIGQTLSLVFGNVFEEFSYLYYIVPELGVYASAYLGHQLFTV